MRYALYTIFATVDRHSSEMFTESSITAPIDKPPAKVNQFKKVGTIT